MSRIEQVRKAVDGILRAQPDALARRAGFVHLYGVALLCAQLALRRGLDVELCVVAGMLHDIWSYKTLDPTDHARHGAPLAAGILAELGCFDEDEVATVREAICHHSDKAGVHGPTDELLKDADVLQHYLYNPTAGWTWGKEPRLDRAREELGL